MERLTHDVDFGLEDWEETLFFVKSDPNGAYNILDIARFQGEAEFDEILKNIALRLAAYEDTGFTPEEVQQMRWIPVEERMPGNSDGAVLLTNGKSVITGYRNQLFGLDGQHGIFAPAAKTREGYMKVIYWMPFPKLPKEET